MITLNPYININFSSCVRLISNTHEHIFEQVYLENCYNRGVRNINLLHYVPSTPQKFDANYQAEYEDYTSASDLTITTKLSPKRNYSSFIDKDGNEVHLSDIVVLPNCEHVNIKNYSYMLHSNYLGSTFGDPGWSKQQGDTQEWVQWRVDHPFLTEYELFNGVRSNMPFGKVFGTLNHPDLTYSMMEQFLERSNGLIKAVEVFNRGYSDQTNQQFEDFYDHLLMNGYKLWGTAVVDWQGDGTQYRPNDIGANILLLPSNYNSLNYEGKQNAILDAYISGSYFPVGLGTIFFTNIVQYDNYVTFTLNKNANTIYGIFDGKKQIIGTNLKTLIINSNKVSKYFRLKVIGDNNEFIFTNPIFVNNNKKKDTYKVLF